MNTQQQQQQNKVIHFN